MTYSVALLELHDELLVALVRVQHLFLAGIKQDLQHRNQKDETESLTNGPQRRAIFSLLTLQSRSPSPAGAEVIITILNY